MTQLERDATDKISAQAARITLNPVIRCLSEYSSIVDVLVQADPMPTALIGGSLKAIIQVSSRFLELYDMIKEQLILLSAQIETTIWYEKEFAQSSNMQELMQTSYFHTVRFWHRAEKECRRHTANRLARAKFSFSISKLYGIIDDIKRLAEAVGMSGPAVQERVARGEREEAAEERRLAGVAREEQKAHSHMTAEERKIVNGERKKKRKQQVGNGY